MVIVYTMEHYSTVKKEITKFVGKCMETEQKTNHPEWGNIDNWLCIHLYEDINC